MNQSKLNTQHQDQNSDIIGSSEKDSLTSPLKDTPHSPPLLLLLSGVFATAISVGGHHSCAIVTGGGVKCWGYNSQGQLGDGSKIDQRLPVDLVLGSGV